MTFQIMHVLYSICTPYQYLTVSGEGEGHTKSSQRIAHLPINLIPTGGSDKYCTKFMEFLKRACSDTVEKKRNVTSGGDFSMSKNSGQRPSSRVSSAIIAAHLLTSHPHSLIRSFAHSFYDFMPPTHVQYSTFFCFKHLPFGNIYML